MRTRLVLISSLVVAGACGAVGGQPSEKDVAPILEPRINMIAGGGRGPAVFKIAELRKTDGQTINGANVYIVFWQAGVEAIADGYYMFETIQPWSPDIRTWDANAPHQPCVQSGQCYMNGLGGDWARPIKAGARLSFSGSTAFEKRESGWHAGATNFNQ